MYASVFVANRLAWFEGGVRLRSPAELRQCGTPGQVPVVAAGVRAPAQERERAQGEGGRGVPSRPLQRALPTVGVAQLLGAQPRQAAVALAQRPLHRGRETARPAARRRREIPRPPEIPAAPHHLGRRGDVVLLQGEVADGAARLVRAQPVPVAARETRAGRRDRPDDHAGQQLVQEQAPARPRRRVQGQVSFGFVFSLVTETVVSGRVVRK